MGSPSKTGDQDEAVPDLLRPGGLSHRSGPSSLWPCSSCPRSSPCPRCPCRPSRSSPRCCAPCSCRPCGPPRRPPCCPPVHAAPLVHAVHEEIPHDYQFGY